MAKRFVALAAAVLFGMSLVSDVMAKTPPSSSDTRGPRPVGQADYLYDVPLKSSSSFARGAIDSIFWGGAQQKPGSADPWPIAIEDGVWDFEGGPFGNLQGWESTDLTDLLQTLGVIPVRRVTSATFSDPRDTDASMNGTGSVWFGALDAETRDEGWPGGQGYSNSWGLNMSRTYTYGGTGDVTINVDYFVDSETQFDYAYVYVINADGIQSPVLNSSVNGRPDDGLGWSGAIQEGTSIGSPNAPATEAINVDASHLSAVNGNDFEVLINFDSDPLYSDGLDSFAGFLNSVNGPLGVDDIVVTGVGLNHTSNFETGTDGWTFFLDPPIGNLMKVANLSALDPVGNACACPLSGNVLVASVIDGSTFPHPKKQNESMASPAAYVGDAVGYNNRLILMDIWEDLPTSNGVGFRIGMHYYPWINPITNETGWTIEPLDQGGGFFFDTSFGGPTCGSFIVNNTTGMPSVLDSIKVVFELLGDCDDFGTQGCTGPQQTNQSPYWDNIQLVSAGSAVDAPIPQVDVLYQDVYPQTNTLLPNATAQIHSYNDNNRADQDQTNANLGDSAVIVIGQDPLSEAYLNFRVWPGPSTNTGNAWFSKYGGGWTMPGGGWAKARMDTAEVGGGSQVILGSYSSYDWPNGQESYTGSSTGSLQKIIRDGVLTPGSTVQYFFSSNYSTSPSQQNFLPDTTDGTYFEFEVLPGYFEVAGNILAPCLLYVDAFNNGAQVPIEEQALDNLLGQVVDVDGVVHDNWDRYDYTAASNNVPGPLAREANGNNGMTGYQSMLYRTILYNTGSFAQEGLRDGDAALLQNFLISDDFNRQSIAKGLWLSGNNMATILTDVDRPQSNALLANFAQATLVCSVYRDAGCSVPAAGDSTLCVRLDEAAGADFDQTGGYSLRGNGCPTTLNFDRLGLAGGTGNLVYVDQDAGLTQTPYASVSNDQFAPGNPANYGVVIDGFSVHYLRTTPLNFTGTDCGNDSTAVLTRTSDVFGFLQVAAGQCDPDPLIIGVDSDGSTAPVAFTRLFQNSPNPFNPQTTVRYQLHDKALVKLQVFDVSGKLVRTLVDNVQELGQYSITWDGTAENGREVSSGVYWARMSTSLGFQSSTKMVVLK